MAAFNQVYKQEFATKEEHNVLKKFAMWLEMQLKKVWLLKRLGPL
jgi:hypothetical protein